MLPDIYKIRATDITAREGRQKRGMHLNVEHTLEYIKLADQLGIDYIELNHPGSSPHMSEIVNRASHLQLQSRIATHFRATRRDFQTAFNTNAKVFNVYIPINPNSVMEAEQSIQEAHNLLSEMLPHALERGTEIRLSIEHGPSLGEELFYKGYKLIGEMEGVSRIGFAETNGDQLPFQTVSNVETIFQLSDIDQPVSIHLHQDLALAPAKMLELIFLAAKHGRRVDFDIGLGGFGERNGTLAHAHYFALLYKLYSPTILKGRYHIEKYAELVRFFEQNSGLKIPESDPLSEAARTHSSGPHVARMINGGGYGFLNHEEFGFGPPILHVGHETTGVEAIEFFALKHLNMRISRETAARCAAAVRKHAMEYGPLNPNGALTEFLLELL